MTNNEHAKPYVTDAAIDREIISRRKMKYNCAAATLCGANAVTNSGYNEEKLRHLVAGFGGGIGKTVDEGTCGALTGAIAALGLFCRRDDAHIVQLAGELYRHFKAELGTVSCGKLKNPEHRTPCNLCCVVAGRKLLEIIEREAHIVNDEARGMNDEARGGK